MAIRQLFLSCATGAADLIGSRAIAEAWNGPSALKGYTVAGLAGHLARAVLTTEAYLSRNADDTGSATDASGYLAAVLSDHDPVDSELHRSVRARGHETAAAGSTALARSVRETIDRLTDALNEATISKPIQVLDDVVLPVSEYLRTRLVELVIHIDDLAVSVHADGAAVTEDAYREVAGVLAETAARRTGGLAVVRSLARRERHGDAVRAL